jgi:hypothetical protein
VFFPRDLGEALAMSLVPHQFMLRLSYPCRYCKEMPREDEDAIVDLSEAYKLENFAAMDERKSFADVRLAWNEQGLGFQVQVKGKQQVPQGDATRPRASDGVTLWIDTRDARTGHRASIYCHQFHLLATGGGPEHDEAVLVQSKIHRALENAPLCQPSEVPFQCTHVKGGYRLEVFFPAAVLNGFDPEQNRRLGFFFAVMDMELGEELLSLGGDFPYWEDPSLWSVLELVN